MRTRQSGNGFDERSRRGIGSFAAPVPGLPLPHLMTYLLDSNRESCCRSTGSTPNHTIRGLHESDGPAILYVAHGFELTGTGPRAARSRALKEDPNTAVYAVDVFGLGESRPNTCGENSYASNYGCDYFYGVAFDHRGVGLMSANEPSTW